MTKPDIKHAIISLFIGLAVTFLMSLLQGVLDIVKAHATDFIGGASATITYLMRNNNKC